MPEKEREENEREGKRKGNVAPRGKNFMNNVVAPMGGQNKKNLKAAYETLNLGLLIHANISLKYILT